MSTLVAPFMASDGIPVACLDQNHTLMKLGVRSTAYLCDPVNIAMQVDLNTAQGSPATSVTVECGTITSRIGHLDATPRIAINVGITVILGRGPVVRE